MLYMSCDSFLTINTTINASSQNLGDFYSALWTSLTLRNFEDLLSSEQVYSIIALAAIANKSFNIASRAFMKLESIDTVSYTFYTYLLLLFNIKNYFSTILILQKKNYNQLSLIIFSKFSPKDTIPLHVRCYSCSNDFSAW